MVALKIRNCLKSKRLVKMEMVFVTVILFYMWRKRASFGHGLQAPEQNFVLGTRVRGFEYYQDVSQ
jgi:uncharacterized membrane protein